MSIKFRSYQTTDGAIIKDLFIRALQTVDASFRAGTWTSDLDDVPSAYLSSGDMLVGLNGKTIVAMGALHKIDNSTCEFKRIAVDPDYHGRGLGQQVLEALEARARKLGFHRVVLDTSTMQQPAIQMYQKNGYREIERKSVESHASGKSLDLIFFQKELNHVR